MRVFNEKIKELNGGESPKYAQAILGSNLTYNTIFLAHRQSGKTKAISNIFISLLLSMDKIKNPTGILFSAQTSQIIKFYLPYFQEALEPIGGKYDGKTNSYGLVGGGEGYDTGRVLFGGANERSKGNRGATGHFLGGDELGDWDEGFAESVFFPMGDVHDAFCVMSGTPRGPNHFKDRYYAWENKMKSGDKDYFACKWTIEDSLREGEISREKYDRLRKRYSGKWQHIWDTEYMLDFDAATPGRVFAPFLSQARRKDKIGRFGFEKGQDVEAFWDLGVNGTACLLRQRIAGRHIYFKSIVQYENVNFAVFFQKKLLPYLWQNGLKISKCVFPHDVKWREFCSPKPRIEVARDFLPGVSFEAVNPIKKNEEAVDKTCRTFERCFFDEEGCSDLLRDLSMVQFENGAFIKKGDAAQYTHSADAFLIGECWREDYSSKGFFEGMGTSTHDIFKNSYEKWVHETVRGQGSEKPRDHGILEPWRH